GVERSQRASTFEEWGERGRLEKTEFGRGLKMCGYQHGC
ncbi:MAG: hypothetical protein ACI87A_003457, partial [Planctomycetota bacterium]